MLLWIARLVRGWGYVWGEGKAVVDVLDRCVGTGFWGVQQVQGLADVHEFLCETLQVLEL